MSEVITLQSSDNIPNETEFQRTCNVCGDSFFHLEDITGFEFDTGIWNNVCVMCWRNAGVAKEWLYDNWTPP